MTRCAWCHEPFGPAATRLRGRVRCARCGVATTDPWPTDAELEAAYGAWYRPAGGRFGGPGDALLARTRAALAGRIDAVAPPGAVLDVGAGDGTLVRALAGRGRQAMGLERGAAAGDGVLDAEVADLPGPFAAVVLWHALEHLRDPSGTLAAAADRLLPRGVLVVAVPNADSVQARVLGDDWLALDLPRHLTHIPASALRNRLTALGLRVTRESHVRGGQAVFGWLHGLVLRATRTDLHAAVRRPEARAGDLRPARRALALAAGAVLLPAAALAAAAEAAAGRGGSVYVEAVKP